MKKSVGKLFILSTLAISTLLACNGDNDKGDVNTNKIVNVYAHNDYGYVENVGQMELYFYDIAGLPYVNVSDYLSFFGDFFDISQSNGVFTFTNRIWDGKPYSYEGVINGTYSASARYNTSTKEFTYDDYTCFTCLNGYAHNPLDLVAGEGVEYDSKQIMKYKEGGYIPGSQTSIKLSDYNIDTVVSGRNLYMPLYTAKTLFLPGSYYSFFYNGTALYESIENADDDGGYSRSIKSTLTFTPSTKYLEYTYNQLRLDLTLRFGMEGYTRTLRSGGTTKKYSAGTELANYRTDMIKSATNFDNNLVNFMANEMDDGGHTAVSSKSYFSSNPEIYLKDYGKEYNHSYNVGTSILSNRPESERELNSKLYDIDDTNKVTGRTVLRLDDFLTDDYNGVSCILKLAKHPIKNNHLVIDLSVNGGGYVYAQYYLVNLLCGSTQRNYYMNSTNNSKGYVAYDIDSNLDGKFGEDTDYPIKPDNVRIDFIISNYTFSAANATAVLTQKLRTTNTYFRGQNSGGGMCSVDGTMMTALGMNMAWSSPDRLCYLDGDNYSYDIIDKGVTSINIPLNNNYSEYSNYTFSIS